MRHLCSLALCFALAAPALAGIRLAEPAPLDAADRELAEALQAARSLDRVAQQVNARIRLPHPVTLRYASCADPNAWYQPERREVRLCLSLARHLAAALAGQLDDEEQMLEALDGALRFIALHEVGHALVDVLELPVTGREEDAVDQFAVWVLLADGDSAAVLSAASLFGSEISGGANLAAAHSLDQQRYFSMLCWVYGSGSVSRDSLIEDWSLPPGRAAACAEEYAQLGRSWQRLLAAHAPRPPARPTAVAAPVAAEQPAVGKGPVATPASPDKPSDAPVPPHQ